MNISQLKNHLQSVNSIEIINPEGQAIPAHFHLTELGLNTRHFIDCGTDIHTDEYACLQLWIANDTDHRLSPEKFLKIIEASSNIIQHKDLEIEVEYQTNTIGRYGLDFKNGQFHLTNKFTDCLAKDKCGVPTQKKKIQLAELSSSNACCTPGGGCC